MCVSWPRENRRGCVAATAFSARSSEAPRRGMAELPTLEAVDLHTCYGLSNILHGISFAVRPGETIGLMGRNGMGKTTLIRTLVGQVRPRRGRVMVNGKEMTYAPPHLIAREGIAYVPEGRGIFPNLSVRENLLMAARPGLDSSSRCDYERVLATFPRLAERLNHGGQQLSSGEQQMPTIGRALLTNPTLPILHEATAGLAPPIADDTWTSGLQN